MDGKEKEEELCNPQSHNGIDGRISEPSWADYLDLAQRKGQKGG